MEIDDPDAVAEGILEVAAKSRDQIQALLARQLFAHLGKQWSPRESLRSPQVFAAKRRAGNKAAPTSLESRCSPTRQCSFDDEPATFARFQTCISNAVKRRCELAANNL